MGMCQVEEISDKAALQRKLSLVAVYVCVYFK